MNTKENILKVEIVNGFKPESSNSEELPTEVHIILDKRNSVVVSSYDSKDKAEEIAAPIIKHLKSEPRQELIDEMIAECKLQIEVRKRKRDNYSKDVDQVTAFNNQIRYHEFMIARLEGYESRLEAGITK